MSLLKLGYCSALPLVWFICVFMLHAHICACTIIMYSDGANVLAANNEDSEMPFTWLSFTPSTDSSYGYVSFSYNLPFGFCQGGMNEKGLFIDANALESTGWIDSPNKQNYAGKVNEIEYSLAHFSSVGEVVGFFETYDMPSLANTKFPVGDACGRTAVIEWSNHGLETHYQGSGYQISTNFVLANYGSDEIPCYRYRLADSILSECTVPTIGDLRNLLDLTHIEGETDTYYSAIYDLVNCDIHLYFFHDYGRVYRFNIKSELGKGKRSIPVSSLFRPYSNAYRVYAQGYGTKELLNKLETKGIDSAISLYYAIKKWAGSEVSVFIDAAMVNSLGEAMLQQGFVDQAKSFFLFCTKEFPDYEPAQLNLNQISSKKADH